MQHRRERRFHTFLPGVLLQVHFATCILDVTHSVVTQTMIYRQNTESR